MADNRINMVSLLDFGLWMGGKTSDILELGDGFTELTEDWAPNVEEKTYINQETSAGTLSNYKLSMTPSRDHMSDEAQKYIDDSFRRFPTGRQAETYYYRFYKTDEISEGKYKAIKVPVVCAPSSTGGTGGESITSSLQINGNGKVTEGVITMAEGKYTFEAGVSAGSGK